MTELKEILTTYPKLAHALAIIEDSCRSGRPYGFSEEHCFLNAYAEGLEDSGSIDWSHRTELLLYVHELLIGTASMPEGHNRQQESAQNEPLSHILPKPRPRRALETEHQETASQRFLRRFGAGDTVSPTNTTSRAMKNPLFTAPAFPPAYVPSPKVAGGVFSSGSFRQLLPVDFQGAVLVTPPLCPMGGTFRLKNDQAHCFSGQCFRGSNAD